MSNNIFIKTLDGAMEWNTAALPLRYVFVGMKVIEDKPKLLEEINELRDDHNIQVVVCTEKKSPDNLAKIIEMGVTHLVDYIYNPGTMNDKYPDSYTSQYAINHPTYWKNINLDGAQIASEHIFSINNQKDICMAIKNIDGTSYPSIGDFRSNKQDQALEGRKPVEALKNWLEEQAKPL
ncbi:MAG TPA: hypothetical protein VGF14_03055 [Alphaproteobacteria bacterium]